MRANPSTPRRRNRHTSRLLAGLLALAVLAAGCSGGPKHRGSTPATGDPTEPAATVSGVPDSTIPSPSGSAVPSKSDRSGGSPRSVPGPTAPGSPAGERGVTKDTVKVAWLDVSKSTYEAAAQFGTSSGTTNDYLYYLTPFVDEINATGGINGRKLVVNVIEYDPKNRDDQLAACVNAAEDAKVFAALTGYMSTGEACLADKQVPVITYNSVSADRLYRQEKGWVRETAMNQDRLVKNLVDWLLQARVITSSTRIGVLTLENPEYKQVAESVLLPYLASKKLSVAAVASFSSQAERTAIEANNMVLQFKDKDVQFVFPAVTWWQLFHFLTQAQAQLYKPEYAALEMGGMTGDALASSLPADEWDGSRGITTTRSGESAAGKPETPEQKECLSAFSARGGKIDTDTDRQFTLLACQQLHLFAKSARLAGAQLTRQSFFAALDSLGAYRERVSAADTLTFRKGKYDAADRFAVVQWRKDCKCYHQIEGFRPSSW